MFSKHSKLILESFKGSKVYLYVCVFMKIIDNNLMIYIDM